MPDQKEAKSALLSNNPFPSWLAMHQAVKAVKAVNAVKETDQDRMGRLQVAASQEHKVNIKFNQVKENLEKRGYACDTFD